MPTCLSTRDMCSCLRPCSPFHQQQLLDIATHEGECVDIRVWACICVSASLSSDTLGYISLLENQDKSICSWFYFASLCGLFRLFRNKSLVLMVNKLDYWWLNLIWIWWNIMVMLIRATRPVTIPTLKNKGLKRVFLQWCHRRTK